MIRAYVTVKKISANLIFNSYDKTAKIILVVTYILELNYFSYKLHCFNYLIVVLKRIEY